MFNGSVGRILDVVPTCIHERCPIIMGSERDVLKVISAYDESEVKRRICMRCLLLHDCNSLGTRIRSPDSASIRKTPPRREKTQDVVTTAWSPQGPARACSKPAYAAPFA